MVSKYLSFLSSPLPFVGGNIANKLSYWESLTSDQSILGFVKGVSLDLTSWPIQTEFPRPYRMNVEQSKFIDEELEALVNKGVIESVEDPSGHYVSNIFLRPKPNGSFRMIIDLSLLNNDIEKKHFKMQHLEVAIDLLSRNCFMASIDLKDAYYSVPIAVESRKFLCFQWRNNFFNSGPCLLVLLQHLGFLPNCYLRCFPPSGKKVSRGLLMWTIPSFWENRKMNVRKQ